MGGKGIVSPSRGSQYLPLWGRIFIDFPITPTY